MTEKRITSFLRPSFIFLLIFDERVGEFEARPACAVSVPRLAKRSRRLFGTTAGPNSWMRIVVGKHIKIRRIFIKRARARALQWTGEQPQECDGQKTETQLPGFSWGLKDWRCIWGVHIWCNRIPVAVAVGFAYCQTSQPLSLCSPATPLIAPARLWDREIGWREDR